MNEGINCLMNIGGNSHIKRAELLFTKKEIEKRESRTITSLSGVWFAPKKEFFFWSGGVGFGERLVVYALRAMTYNIYVLYIC
jgi:hypothetical protein